MKIAEVSEVIESLKDLLKETGDKFLMLFALCLIVGGVVGIYTEKTLEPKMHTVSTMYVVKDGDTLIDICYEYQQLDCRKPYILEYVDEIKALNPFLQERKNNIRAGDEIKIQYLERD